MTPAELPVVLALALRAQGPQGTIDVELVARSRVDRQELHRWPIDVLRVEPKRSSYYCLATDGLTAGVVLAGRVYAVDLSELQAGTCPRPLAFVPEQGPVLAAADGPTRLKYRAVGGQPPYTLKASLPGAGDLGLVRPAAAGNLELEVDVSGYIAEQKLPLARALIDQSAATERAEAIMTRYRQAMTPAFHRLTGRDPAGVPVAMPLEVRVLDSGSQSAKFCHYLLVDVPPDTLVPSLDAEIAVRWKGTTVAAAAQQRMHLRRWREFGDTARKEQTPALGTAQLEPAAHQAIAAVETRWQQTLFQARLGRCRNAPRVWTTTDGRTARARLLRAGDGVAVLVSDAHRPVEAPLDRLSPADQQYVQTTALNADAAAREAAGDVESQLRYIGQAFLAFKARHTHMPPQALAAPDGMPALSWRVLLLPYLDATELYALFRLDEPWDSVHNRQLLKYLPPVYRIPGVEPEPGRTAVVGLAGSETMFPPSRLLRDEDCLDHPASVVLAVVAAKDHAVAWTQPADLPVDREARFAEDLDWRDDATLVLLCDGSLRRMQRTTSVRDWLKAADRDNGGLWRESAP